MAQEEQSKIIMQAAEGDASERVAEPRGDATEKSRQMELATIDSKLDAIMSFLGVPEQETVNE